MKKIVILFSVLLITFMGVWVFKAKTPSVKSDGFDQSAASNAWWADEKNLPKADVEWILDPEIPENYIPVPGEKELYMVVDDNGLITAYRHREQQEDGTWIWETVNPDIPDNYEVVEGLIDVYKVTNEKGETSYFKYIRNDDDTFAFVPVDENGNVIEKTPSGTDIPDNYKRITGNIYAVYNENNVIIGYKERTLDANGNYTWKDCDKPQQNDAETSSSSENPSNNSESPMESSVIDENSEISNSENADNSQVIQHPNGTYTETETIISTETSGGWRITYQTVITRTYDSHGLLLSTKKEGPYEISKEKATDDDGKAPDKSKIKGTIREELARVSVGLNYKEELAQAVLAEINAERASAGLGSLTMNSNFEAMYLAKIRASDMAIYNHSDYDSPMYGSLATMCETFNITSTNPSEILWKTSGDKTATAIASRLKIMSNDALMSSDHSTIGISIVAKNGYYYIDVILV
ncbi:MAG: hypothetical protein IJY88_01490 [Clostridia bacterium]|nr:hypothetical protein [Clostridia bacterium]